MRKVLLNLPKKLDYKFISKLEQEKLTDSEYILKLIVNDLDSKINLGEGFYYYKYLEKFYNSEKKKLYLV